MRSSKDHVQRTWAKMLMGLFEERSIVSRDEWMRGKGAELRSRGAPSVCMHGSTCVCVRERENAYVHTLVFTHGCTFSWEDWMT